MVKGMSRKVVVIKSPDKRIFEEAIFIVKEDLFKRSGIAPAEVIDEAQKVANNYINTNCKKERRLSSLPPKLVFAAGAGATGIVWLLCSVFGLC